MTRARRVSVSTSTASAGAPNAPPGCACVFYPSTPTHIHIHISLSHSTPQILKNVKFSLFITNILFSRILHPPSLPPLPHCSEHNVLLRASIDNRQARAPVLLYATGTTITHDTLLCTASALHFTALTALLVPRPATDPLRPSDPPPHRLRLHGQPTSSPSVFLVPFSASSLLRFFRPQVRSSSKISLSLFFFCILHFVNVISLHFILFYFNFNFCIFPSLSPPSLPFHLHTNNHITPILTNTFSRLLRLHIYRTNKPSSSTKQA